jgi:pantoate--beta-alanine ligase
MKLFNMVMPQVAVFGQKDFQQLFIIKQLVKQFNLPIEIIAANTVRESSGLAMSSRNGYLSTAQRNQANQLSSALQSAVNEIKINSAQNGNVDFDKIEQQAIATLKTQGWIVDYVSTRSVLTLSPASPTDHHLVILGAAKLGNTRLIDNIEFLR